MSARVINKTHDLIVNNDMTIIDFLADLDDRSTIRTLGENLTEQKDQRLCIVAYHKKEKLITVLISNDPFEINKPGNILMLFYTPRCNLTKMTVYFMDWLKITDYSEKDKRKALKEIIYLLIECENKLKRQNVQTDFLG